MVLFYLRCSIRIVWCVVEINFLGRSNRKFAQNFPSTPIQMNGTKYENKLVYTEPLDLLFARVQEVLAVLVPELRKDRSVGDAQGVREESHAGRVAKLWAALTDDERAAATEGLQSESKDRSVVRYLLSTLKRIQELTTVEEKPEKEKDLLMISLYDLKVFNALVTFLVIDGIHSCLPRGIGVPIGLRTKQFGLAVSSTPSEIDELTSDQLQQLKEITSGLVDILKVKGDVRDLIMLGPYTVDFLSAAGAFGLNPKVPKEDRTVGIQAYNYIQRQIDSYSLYLHLTSLIRPKTPPWFIGGISHSLAVIPLNRTDGIKSLLEFVSGIREKDDVQMSDLDKATRILKSIPRNVPIDVYSRRIGSQLMNIIASPTSTLAVPTLQVVTALYSQRPEIITLGLQKVIAERLNPPVSDFAEELVLVSKNGIDEAMACLYLVVTKSHAVDLIEALTDGVVLPLWNLVCYLAVAKKSSDLATSLLVSILNQNDKKTDIYVRLMSENLLIKNYSKFWKFAPSAEGGAEIRQLALAETSDLLTSMESLSLNGDMSSVFSEIEVRVKKFSDMLDFLDEGIISGFFVSLLSDWFTSLEDPFMALTTTRLLEAILEKSKKKLLKSPEDIIAVVKSALEECKAAKEKQLGIAKPNTLQGEDNRLEKLVAMGDSDDEEEEAEGDSDDEDNDSSDTDEHIQILQLCFSLISAILMELDASDDKGKNETIMRLQSIIPLVSFILKQGPASVKSQARSCKAKLSVLSSDSSLPAEAADTTTQRFMKAVQLMEDPSAPVQAHGMHLLKTLIDSKDASIEFRLCLNLYVDKLSDKDSFIYLSAIKGLEALAGRYRFQVVDRLLSIYTDDKRDLDVRLRVGEVLLKFIQMYGSVLQTENIAQLMNNLISLVARHENEADLVRMSAMSILGEFYETAPAAAAVHLEDLLDCAINILLLETDDSKNIMRRSAISMIASVLQVVQMSEILPQQLASIKVQLNVASRDADPLVRAQAATAKDILSDAYTT